MLTDDYHDHYMRPENEQDLLELVGFVNLHKPQDKKWLAMYHDIRNCIAMFGYKNISLFYNEDMKYGNGIEEFLSGFWINLREADYNEGYLEYDNTTITIENGFMYLQNRYTPEEKKVDNKVNNGIKSKKGGNIMPVAKKKTAKKTTAKKTTKAKKPAAKKAKKRQQQRSKAMYRSVNSSAIVTDRYIPNKQ